MKKKISLLLITILSMQILQGCQDSVLTMTMTDEELETIIGAIEATETFTFPESDNLFTDLELYGDYDTDNVHTVVFADGTATSSDKKAKIDGGTVTLSSDTNYIISGDIDEGQIIIDAYLSYTINLILDGVSINNGSGPAISVLKANKVLISGTEGTKNTLTSSGLSEEISQNSCIYSVRDITLNGDGLIDINSDQIGIYSQGNVSITNGELNIVSNGDGICSESSIRVGGGYTQIHSNSSPIKTAQSDNSIIVDGVFLCFGNALSDTFSNSSTVDFFAKELDNPSNSEILIPNTVNDNFISFSPKSDYSSILVAFANSSDEILYTTE